MRDAMLAKIHAAHLGIDSCINKAKESVYWPGIYNDISTLISTCTICQESAPQQQPLPLQTPEIPKRPRQKIAIDLFQNQGKDYLITVDYYSDYFEIDRLHSTTSKAIINALEPHLARHGTVDILISDNCPNLVSNEFAEFCSKWEIQHATISPHHSQGNGKVESAVKIAKSLMKKCAKSGYNINLALLDYRNTPCKQIGLSPAQRLFSRRTKTLLPTSEKILQPEIPTDVRDKIKRKRQDAKLHYDKKAKEIPELVTGQDVYVKNKNKDGESNWVPGKINKKLTDRSYIVQTQGDGNNIRRNRIDIKPKNHPEPRHSARKKNAHSPYVHIP